MPVYNPISGGAFSVSAAGRRVLLAVRVHQHILVLLDRQFHEWAKIPPDDYAMIDGNGRRTMWLPPNILTVDDLPARHTVDAARLARINRRIYAWIGIRNRLLPVPGIYRIGDDVYEVDKHGAWPVPVLPL